MRAAFVALAPVGVDDVFDVVLEGAVEVEFPFPGFGVLASIDAQHESDVAAAAVVALLGIGHDSAPCSFVFFDKCCSFFFYGPTDIFQ